MMVSVFIILLLAMLCAWIGRRRLAFLLYIITIGFSIGIFISHLTSSLSLQL